MTPLPLIAYRWLTRMLEPLAPRLLDARVRRGKEDQARVDERLGIATVARPSGDLVWLHGASVGETLSLLPLIERLSRDRPDLRLLVTSGTVTSAAILRERMPTAVIHQFPPVDAPGAVDAFLDHWRPLLGVFVESELWPNLLLRARARGVRLALVSARITQKTADGWARFPRSAAHLLGAFDAVLPQDEVSAERLRGLGAHVDGLANLKLAGAPLPHDAAVFSRLSAAIGDRPVVLAASTHEDEEVAMVEALSALPGQPCLIVLPRHPERGADIVETLRMRGHQAGLRSRGEAIEGAGVYIADTLNEMGLFLRLADVVVLGGSFGPVLGRLTLGGHNPLEPARLGKPVVTGPDGANWTAVNAAMVEAGGLIQIGGFDDLPGVIAPLLANPPAAKAMGERARRAAADAASGLDRLWAVLQPLLPPPPARGRL
ncbi:3-deoxy-D-manno-octulosonic acid transferase [Brevundimonas sp. PAMC22021]|uniref:3-deoxy-D-manno-octulosonic acid transferase n=1 Tax=Brevundimonas sp. PAMC22021 TaxID=2861285 RepID=UPI001C63968E|nr:3-deoxy-D-manno-octulosonic acid transferase [Brevundimonas sp. PAMC22021]QYF87462.1 3-deoxy-D-manno-octulosonic acid transferase [Brevundimonas sp. PAMC22021]